MSDEWLARSKQIVANIRCIYPTCLYDEPADRLAGRIAEALKEAFKEGESKQTILEIHGEQDDLSREVCDRLAAAIRARKGG